MQTRRLDDVCRNPREAVKHDQLFRPLYTRNNSPPLSNLVKSGERGTAPDNWFAKPVDVMG